MRPSTLQATRAQRTLLNPVSLPLTFSSGGNQEPLKVCLVFYLRIVGSNGWCLTLMNSLDEEIDRSHLSHQLMPFSWVPLCSREKISLLLWVLCVYGPTLFSNFP